MGLFPDIGEIEKKITAQTSEMLAELKATRALLERLVELEEQRG